MDTSGALGGLLPDPDSSPRCAPFTSDLGVDPAGTAFAAQLVVLIEAALPWPKPVNEHPVMAGSMALMRSASVPTRVLAAVPRTLGGGSVDQGGVDQGSFSKGSVFVVAYRQLADSPTMSRTSFEVPEAELVDLVSQLTSGAAPGGLAYVASHIDKAGPAVMICTQGSHDVCCGEMGETLAVETEDRFPEVEVFRVSHTGGHRFAPTALTLPDGRMWAYLSADDLAKIFGRSGPPVDVADKCRGWIGAARGAAQTAERAVFAAEPWAWDELTRTVEVLERQTPDSSGWLVGVTGGGRRWEIGVEVVREIPTITCGGLGGQPAKPAREFGVVSFQEV